MNHTNYSSSSVNCVVQTPRTPSTAAAHYFDDILNSSKPGMKIRRLRRSSTHRNIGGFGARTPSIGGTTEDDADDDTDTEPDEAAARRARMKRATSVGGWDVEALKEKAEMDERVAEYVEGRMQRIDDDGLAGDMGDEVENSAFGEEYFGIQR
jgi:hypothetical protein